MDTCTRSAPETHRLRQRWAGFSLVEVTLAIGIVAFSFLAVFGLIPTGLSIFRGTMDTAVGSEIAQRVLNEAKQADFSALTLGATGAANETLRKPVRYFDVQGDELTAATAPPAGTVYQVNTRIMPVTVMPSANSNGNLALVTVQIAYNPGNQDLTVVAANSPNDPAQPLRNLWNGSSGGTTNASAAMPSTWSTMVARNR